MIVVFGKRLLGKCDEVPGMFHVATQFFHIDYLPLLPLQSYIVISQDGNSFRGVPIPMSGKSVLCGWGRAGTLIGGVVAIIIALVQLGTPRTAIDEKLIALIAAVLVSMAFAFLKFHPFCTRASFARACQLAEDAGLNEAGMQKIYQIFGQAGDRGFDVAPITPQHSSALPVATAGTPYPCRVCRRKFAIDHVYSEADGQIICKRCWQTTEAKREQG